ncbi:hypothetical protein [Streptomyces syringium]|uniref:hypothetical protein n=1 Tax=Streptomyces syringium TaxID=76729 RepID=UPI00345151CF
MTGSFARFPQGDILVHTLALGKPRRAEPGATAELDGSSTPTPPRQAGCPPHHGGNRDKPVRALGVKPVIARRSTELSPTAEDEAKGERSLPSMINI